jgi:hypothetical protein
MGGQTKRSVGVTIWAILLLISGIFSIILGVLSLTIGPLSIARLEQSMQRIKASPIETEPRFSQEEKAQLQATKTQVVTGLEALIQES